MEILIGIAILIVGFIILVLLGAFVEFIVIIVTIGVIALIALAIGSIIMNKIS